VKESHDSLRGMRWDRRNSWAWVCTAA